MKLHIKFLLSFMTVVLALVMLLSLYVNNVLTDYVRQDKANSYSLYLQQLVTSTRMVTKEVEQTFFNQYTEAATAEKLLSQQSPLNKKLSVEGGLVSIPLNTSTISSVLAVDLDGNSYFASSVLDERADVFDDVRTLPLSEASSLWLRDAQGRIFLKKDLFQTFPLKQAGLIIARMNTPVLLSTLGLDDRADGMLALITEEGKLLLATGGLTDEMLVEILDQEPLSYQPVSREIMIDGKPYYYTMQPAPNRIWYALEVVPMQEMLAMPLALSRMIWLGSIGIIVLALLVSFLLSRSISRNVKQLASSMAEVSHGNFETEIAVRSHDEIGDLAERFRWMQGELKNVTMEMVQRATEKQNTEYEMLELRYRSLQAQISPHFFCNVLSSIDALALMKRTGEVSTISTKAARYLRDNLNAADHKFTCLSQEIRFVQEYADLYNDLYHSPFRLEVSLSDDAGDCEVPSMLLQPLVENALVHGFPLDNPDRQHIICISAETTGDSLVIYVSDDGQGISQEVIKMVERAELDREYNKKMSGFGLRSVLQRLRLLYGQNQELRIASVPGVQTLISIRIPYRLYQEV
ncbi:MAG: histidine kinase [Eubacteriales bacterium]|nr:histidine kinase [Eubacteriales bacterium]